MNYVLIGIGLYLCWLAFKRLLESRRSRREAEAYATAMEHRRQMLMAKYGDDGVVEALMAGYIWQDMTKEQLIDSWGSPADISTKVLKSKVKETFKYGRTGVNRFTRRALLENDRVVGWEE